MLEWLKKYDWKVFLHPQKLFLENLGLKQTIIKNTFWLTAAEGVSKLLKFFLFIYIARILGATEYGKFSFALAFVSLFLIFSHLGVFKILTREFARDATKEKDFSALFSLKMILSAVTFILIFIGSFFITDNSLIRAIIWILGVEILLNSFLVFIYSFFRARQKMEYEAAGEILTASLVTGICFFILFHFPSARNLGLGYLFGTLLALLAVLIILYLKFLPFKLSFNRAIWKNYLAMSWPLALAAVLATVYSYIDSTMMGYSGQITETGWYAAAQKIVAITIIPVGLMSTSFFPLLSKLVKESKERLQKVWNYFMEAVIFISLPLVVGGMVLARKLIDFVYDPSYFPSILAFQILLLGFGIAVLTDPFGHSLLVAGQQKKIFWVALFGAITNVALNLILIPRYSLYGASFATVCAFSLRFFLYFKFTLKYTSIKPINTKVISSFLLACLASLLMYFAISYPRIYNLHVLWIILIGALVYAMGCLAFKNLKKCAIKSY